MSRYLIVADDFTGANDTGVQLKRRGINTNVVFTSDLIDKDQSSFVIDTESRSLSEDDAYNKIKNILNNVELNDFKYLIKKVDSTLRGNVAKEIKAVDEEYKSELVIFAPALPDLKRTTVNGIHMLNDVPITYTEMAKDPLKPVKEDNITRILESVYDEEVFHINLDSVKSKQIDFSSGRVFTFDVVTNEDMRNIIKAAMNTGKKVLWIGTAAMADNLFEIEKSMKPVLSIVASVSAVTRQQVKHAESKGVELVKLPIYDIIQNKVEPERYINQAEYLLKEGKDVVLLPSSSYDQEEYLKSNEIGNKAGMATEEISNFVNTLIGSISKNVLKKTEVSGVFLTGGETAIGFFKEVESLGSSIVQEIAIGIPLMKLVGGPFEGLKVVTKAGAFGGEDAITYAIRKLKEV
jgi:uncharacterized protein YgbK (DUF1537 family)